MKRGRSHGARARRRIGSSSISTSTPSTIRRIISTTPRTSSWNGRASSVSARSPSPCTTRFSIGRKFLPTPRRWEFSSSRRPRCGWKARMWCCSTSSLTRSKTCAPLTICARCAPGAGDSLFCFAPHPFFVLGASIGERLAAGDRLLRRDRDLPFSQRLVRSQPARPPGRGGAWQAAPRHLRCASPAGLWRALHQHPAPARTDGRSRPARAAHRVRIA